MTYLVKKGGELTGGEMTGGEMSYKPTIDKYGRTSMVLIQLKILLRANTSFILRSCNNLVSFYLIKMSGHSIKSNSFF